MSKILKNIFTNNLNGYILNLIKKKSTDQSKPIYWNKVETNKIIISDEFKLDDGVKKIIGYKNG